MVVALEVSVNMKRKGLNQQQKYLVDKAVT